MSDFERRSFRLSEPAARQVLERHARYFLTGFGLRWRRGDPPHEALAELPAEEIGFAYEGAAFRAQLMDASPVRRPRPALAALLDGKGASYAYLIHVGAGWASTPLGRSRPGRWPLPPTAVLRWLALDGAGFSAAFFEPRHLGRRVIERRPVDERPILLGGVGRALWFVESADVDAIAARIAGCSPDVAPSLWSGVGLAAAYAGPLTMAQAGRLRSVSGSRLAHLAQGVAFGVTARHRSGIVPSHTIAASWRVLGELPPIVADESERPLAALAGRSDPRAFMEWKASVREAFALDSSRSERSA